LAKHDTIRLPILNAITYDFIYNLKKEVKDNLPIKYRRMVQSEVKTKNFCDRASMDERMSFLAMIGVRFSISFFPSELYNGVQIHDFIKSYNKGEIHEAKKKQISLNVYATTDKEIIHLYNIMGNASNQESVLRQLDFNKVGNVTKEWSKRLDSPEQLELLDSIENADLVAETITNASIGTMFIKDVVGLRQIDLQLLLKLYVNRTKFFTKEGIYGLLDGVWQKQKISNSIRYLMNNGYLNEYAYATVPKFTINGKGIAKVQEFINYVIKSKNFS